MVGSRFETEGTHPSVSFHSDKSERDVQRSLQKFKSKKNFIIKYIDWAISLPENVIVKKKMKLKIFLKR